MVGTSVIGSGWNGARGRIFIHQPDNFSAQGEQGLPILGLPGGVPVQLQQQFDGVIILFRVKCVGKQDGNGNIQASGNALHSVQVGRMAVFNFLEGGF